MTHEKMNSNFIMCKKKSYYLKINFEFKMRFKGTGLSIKNMNNNLILRVTLKKMICIINLKTERNS